MRWNLVMERTSVNRLNPENARRKIRRIAAAAQRNKSLGFVAVAGQLKEPERVVDPNTNSEAYKYRVRLRIEKDAVRNPETAARQFEHVVGVVARCANAHGWRLQPQDEVEVSSEPVRLNAPVEESRPEFVVPVLTQDVLDTAFKGVYERDSHIRLIHDSVKAYFWSKSVNKSDPSVEVSRSHVLLKGKPAGCKTTLFERFKAWYELSGECERVLFVDAHTMTKAGLENYLLQKAADGSLPEIIVLEEIEKQDPQNLLALVSVMGSGYISKMNARIGLQKELANVLVWATCNDEQIIKSFRNGVLWSRFAHKLHCSRPSQDLMRKILLDKIQAMGGNPAWAEAAMEFAYGEQYKKCRRHPMDDPREIKGLLDGQDRLLDNSYQKDLLEVILAEVKEAEADAEAQKQPEGIA